MTNVTPSRGARPGGRSARIRESVLATVLEMLATHSIPELNIKAVAAAAGVAETTIYRRWGTLPDLIADALSTFAVAENPIPDTGSLEADLTQLLHNVVAIIERPSVRRIFRFAMAIDSGDGASADARREFWRVRFEAGTSVVLRAVERGEIAPVPDPVEVVETLVGTAYIRSFLRERPITDELVAISVRHAMAVAHGDALRPAHGT